MVSTSLAIVFDFLGTIYL